MGNVRRHLWLSHLEQGRGATGIYQGGDRDPTKLLTMHKTAPSSLEEFLTQNTTAKVEK